MKNELEELEQEQLNDRLMGAERAPVHSPTRAQGLTEGRERECGFSYYPESETDKLRDGAEATQRQEEDDEEEQLRQLQAELAM